MTELITGSGDYDRPPSEDGNGEWFIVTDAPDRRVWLRQRLDDERMWDQCVVQKIAPMLEQNKLEYNESFGSRWGDGRKVASIPNSIYWSDDYQKAVAQQDDTWRKRHLNDSDNVFLRTHRGNL